MYLSVESRRAFLRVSFASALIADACVGSCLTSVREFRLRRLCHYLTMVYPRSLTTRV